MLANSFIEKGSIILKNINNGKTVQDQWYSGSNYGFYSIPYSDKLTLNHYYYQRFTYKFTTTNQSPTWVIQYFQGGGGNGGARINNPVANTEYTASKVMQPQIINTSAPITGGTIYQGQSSAIAGVTGYAKNVLVYDVTHLYYALLAKGIVTNTATLTTWCDNNLVFKSGGVLYDVTSLVNDTSNKVVMKEGFIVASKFIETDGMKYYSISDNIRNNTWFDSASGVGVYNNQYNGTVTHTRVDAKSQGSPFYPNHKYVLRITTNGTASPSAGGFIATHTAAANKVFIERFVAKVPVGYTVNAAHNSQGSGASVTYLSSRAGTGKWEEYAILYKCGSSGSFSTGGHVYISGSNNTSVTWYLAYVNNCDITSDPDLAYYSVLSKKTNFKSGKVYASDFDETNILPNGDGSNQTTSMLPSGWSWDTSDVAGNAKASIVQPVGASAGDFGTKVKINPLGRYKISMWIKCKQDMTSFLVRVRYYTANGVEYSHDNTIFVNGTKTTLASALNPGETTVSLASGANWKVGSYSKLAFRSGSTWSMTTYNDKGSFNPNGSTGVVKSVSGNTITLNSAYSGTVMPAGTVIVEGFDGSAYPYPIQKANLPTDNTWKYVEGYFGGDNVVYEGASPAWSGIPAGARDMILGLNFYKNDGTVPIKYADIRIEEVGTNCGERKENKIQFKKVD